MYLENLKQKLKNGQRVVLRNGDTFLVQLNVELRINGLQNLLFVSNGGFLYGSDYSDNLIHSSNSDSWDVMKIYDYDTIGSMLDLSKFGKLIWERKERKTMTVQEIEKELGYSVFVKVDGTDNNWDYI